jgi:glycosyltransferase involved in cell wall biosynthesis
MNYGLQDGVLGADDAGLAISRFKPYSFFRGASFDQPLSLSYVKSAIAVSDDFDVVHVHDFPKLCNDSLILALKKLKPAKSVVLTPHGAGPVAPANKISSKAYWASGVPVQVVRAADHLITVTPLQKKVFTRVCDEQKISMIYEAIPPQYFVSAPSFVDDGKLKILFIGRIIQEKGIRNLLYAVSSASKMSNNKVELRCVGPDYGFMQEALKIIKELHLEDVVHMLGALPENEKLIPLKWCDVLMLPSYYEAFGIPIIEAMAHAKPVIATKTIGALSLIEDNETGFLVDFDDPQGMAFKLMNFVNDPQLKLQLGNKALISVLHFSMQKMIQRHIDLYTLVIQSSWWDCTHAR